MENSNGKFWLVWGNNKGGPTRKHSTYQEALDEAARLASRTQDEFFVMSMVAAVKPAAAPVTVSTYTE